MRRSAKAALLVTLVLVSVALIVLAAAVLTSGESVTLSTPPSKTMPSHPVLGSRLGSQVARVESGEISASEAGMQSPISLGDSVALSITVTGNAAEVIGFLEENGADTRNVVENYIEAYVPVPLLASLSEQTGVARVRELVPPHPAYGGVTSQGVAEHGSIPWNEEGYRGQNIKIGIIDVGFKGLGDLLGNELPEEVNARCYTTIAFHSSSLWGCETTLLGIREAFAGPGDHGTMVAEAVIDVAPEASLYVANPYTPADIRKTVEWMIAEEVSVINYSSGWLFGGPGDGTSPSGVDPLRTVDLAVKAGIVWVSSAGNEARRTWFGDYSDTDQDGYLSFSADTSIEDNGLELGSGGAVVAQLRWDDSWNGASRDLDLLLISEEVSWFERGRLFGIGLPQPARTLAARILGGGRVLLASEDRQNGQPDDVPLEWLIFAPASEGKHSLRIVHRSGSEPEWIQLMVSPGVVNRFDHFTSLNSIISPAESSSPGMLAVGAAPWYSTGSIESYSSRGPTPDGRIKPDIVGATCAESSLAPLRGGQRGFCGTSQAAPHVAGLAALVRQRFPEYAPRDVVEYLKGHAEQKGTNHPNNTWGHGFARLPDPASGCRRLLAREGLNFGGWAAGCSSEAPGRGYAQYFNLVLLSPAEVTLSLASGTADPYLYVREGYAAAGTALHENNDHTSSSSGSRIEADLKAGAYTLEATTYATGQTGSFTLEVDIRERADVSPENSEEETASSGDYAVAAEETPAKNVGAVPGPSPHENKTPPDLEGIAVDRAALVALYNATGGPNWKNNKNWLTDKPLFLWYRVYTDDSGRVIQVHMGDNGLAGEIPADIASMDRLRGLDLSQNSLSGEIPAALGKLGKLEYLELEENQLTGIYPGS